MSDGVGSSMGMKKIYLMRLGWNMVGLCALWVSDAVMVP